MNNLVTEVTERKNTKLPNNTTEKNANWPIVSDIYNKYSKMTIVTTCDTTLFWEGQKWTVSSNRCYKYQGHPPFSGKI